MTTPEMRTPVSVELFHPGSSVDPSAQQPPQELRPQPFVAPAGDSLVYQGEVNGAQLWVARDQSIVQYRADAGTLTFHAWKRSELIYWSIGASMTADGPDYVAADILSNYYMTLPDRPACEIVKTGHTTDRGNKYCDEWQWGLNSQQPDRVASLCRAQWNNARFSGVVTAGSGCTNYAAYSWPPGYPTDWPPLLTGVQVTPEEITMNVPGIGLDDFATAQVSNHNTGPVTAEVEPSSSGLFSWTAGAYTVAANSSMPIQVAFEGAPAAGTYQTTLRLTVGSASFEVLIRASVISKGPPK
jgi:hypothetical protein